MKLKKIFILGNIGSGKSTLAKRLCSILKIKHYDLDNLFWTNKFNKKRSEKVRDEKFKELCNKKEWIIEGVYSTWIEYGIKKADLVVLLKISKKDLLWRITKRSIKKEEEKKLEIERYTQNFSDYLQLIKATLKYYVRKDGRGYLKHKELIEKNKVDFIILKTSKEINNFLKEIS